MITLIVSGKTIEDAVQKGLAQLEATKDQVTVRVIDQPSRGLFGLIGVRAAKVELTLQEAPAKAIEQSAIRKADPSAHLSSVSVADSVSAHKPQQAGKHAHEEAASNGGSPQIDGIEEAKQFVLDVARSMGLEVEIHVDKRKDNIMFDIAGSDLGLIIGRRGQTLDSLQYLTNLVANRYSDHHLRIVLDAEQFRERRKQTLESLSERLANKVIRTRKELMLEPMSPQERKIIHAKLQDHPKVKTYSKGEEPNRRIVITLKS
ncbi:protein jag [Paenibacillus sp. ACRRX]|uniref:RNA-binding cell elongation regulator Jag/EloR n=1 Tax=unclassified Paenibacillus TaxID=185978 RepID=UPI001EF72A29|nr:MULTISPECIES: RNA-binding cell elongation regulator Jag/EloR [unclassified Paenibacillus]MCG7408388.1 protein jag [Paenibacillus sp. ACRRX]MDK8181227.1 RNA-binding cell elongation regulator Jag/EloR [Paenibacillus sp. UMB4589-SE434]